MQLNWTSKWWLERFVRKTSALFALMSFDYLTPLEETRCLSCKNLAKNGYLVRSCKTMVILQDLARRMVIFQDSCKKNGYLARSCKTNGHLSRFLQDGWLSCKIVQDFGRKSCKTMYRLARFYKILARSRKITIRIRLGTLCFKNGLFWIINFSLLFAARLHILTKFLEKFKCKIWDLLRLCLQTRLAVHIICNSQAWESYFYTMSY